ncbi:hypothetical protein [Nocardiopsis halophila]|uniref:hypothetical protein n=1 Tax=Nocardiopsis halophila TaxID=141692 RepID=UPI000346EBDA|nr:hypothetical protein [Nocardiopsis halophila]
MHAMIRRYRMGAGTIEDLMRTVDRRFADNSQAELGILGYQAIALDEETVMTVTLFATERRLRASEPAAEGIREALSDFKVEALEAADGPVMIARGSQRLAEPVRPAP